MFKTETAVNTYHRGTEVNSLHSGGLADPARVYTAVNQLYIYIFQGMAGVPMLSGFVKITTGKHSLRRRPTTTWTVRIVSSTPISYGGADA